MAPHLSTEMRSNVVIWRFHQQRPVADIAQLAHCTETTIYRILRYHRQYGQISNPFARTRGRPRLLSTADLTYLQSVLVANPSLYLDELQEKLLLARNCDISIATISRALRGLALSHKKIAKKAAERNELLRATWQAQYGDIPAEFFVWLDESSVDDKTNQRTEGWSGIGRACVRRATFIRGQRWSVLPAFSHEGIIALDLFEGSVNKERFLHFLNKDLVCYVHLVISFFVLMLSFRHRCSIHTQAIEVLSSWTIVLYITMMKFERLLKENVVSEFTGLSCAMVY